SRYHLMIHQVQQLSAATIVQVLEKTDAFRQPEKFAHLLLACQADAQGRGIEVEYPPALLWRRMYEACAAVSVKNIIKKGIKGAAIQEKLRQERIFKVQLLLDSLGHA